MIRLIWEKKTQKRIKCDNNKQSKRKKKKAKPTDKRDKTNKRKKNGTVLLGIPVGDVPPGSPNPDQISDLKMYFTAPVLSDL